MKIKATKEGRPGIYLPDKKSLKSFIRSKKFETIHHFFDGQGMIIGADHDVDSVLQDIDNADRLAIFTDENQNLGHALSIIKGNQLGCYFIGKIKESNIEVTI